MLFIGVSPLGGGAGRSIKPYSSCWTDAVVCIYAVVAADEAAVLPEHCRRRVSARCSVEGSGCAGLVTSVWCGIG